jgi:hypothetical protein
MNAKARPGTQDKKAAVPLNHPGRKKPNTKMPLFPAQIAGTQTARKAALHFGLAPVFRLSG